MARTSKKSAAGRSSEKSSSGRGRRSQNMPERDEEGRFMSENDDDESGYDENEDDNREERGGSRGYQMRGRRQERYDYEDDRNSQNGRNQGGWFGDSEGHSQASRRGWDNPDHGPSGWYGDSRGHAEASRRGWDNPDHGPSGWYGDPEGHSEASRRGWEDRGGGRSRSAGYRGESRYDRDYDDRGSRGRYQNDDDDRSYRSRSSRQDDDGRGWHGDPRGHAEASRRGWENRR